MAQWNESDYLQRADEIAKQFVVSRKPLNEISVKVARENGLSPDEIRTLVRLSNVAAFREIFKTKNDGDKMVEFETGDPEAVIQSLVQEAQMPPETANVNNDKLAAEIPDMMLEKRLGRPLDLSVKTAAYEDVPEKPMRRDLAILAMRKLAENFEVERRIEGTRWETKLAELAQVFRRAEGYGPSYESFEKDAYAEYGDDANPELNQLRSVLRREPSVFATKIAELKERHVVENTKELELLKLAHQARCAYTKYQTALEWLSKNTPNG